VSPAANPRDPKFSSSLWTRTSDNTRLSNFKYIAAEKILDNLNASELMHGMNGFRMCEHFSNLEDLPTRDDHLIKLNDNKKNVIFAGCSMTSGTGLEVGERWVDKVYLDLNKDKEYSGLFNLGQEGGGMQSQIRYIFKYCQEYGIPDLIIFNIPDFWRMTIDDNTYKVYSSSPSNYSQDAVGKLVCSAGKQLYESLEIFCDLNKINLLSFSWDRVTNSILKDFKTFMPIDEKDIQKEIFNYDDGGKYAILARDDIHPGTATHMAWSKKILDKLAQML
jgi:hypothetical protein